MITDKEYIDIMHFAKEHKYDELSLYIGIELLWDENGYKTLMRCIYFGEEMSNDRLEEICFCLAKQLDTEVAIGDFVHLDYPDLYIVYTPAGERWFAADACKEEYFDLERIEYKSTENPGSS